jgi:hypothetical protein
MQVRVPGANWWFSILQSDLLAWFSLHFCRSSRSSYLQITLSQHSSA